MNSLPKTVTRQRRGCDLNPGPSAPESSTLFHSATEPPLQPWKNRKKNMLNFPAAGDEAHGPACMTAGRACVRSKATGVVAADRKCTQPASATCPAVTQSASVVDVQPVQDVVPERAPATCRRASRQLNTRAHTSVTFTSHHMGTELNSTRTHLNCADTVFRVTRPSYTVLVYFADNGRLYHRGYI